MQSEVTAEPEHVLSLSSSDVVPCSVVGDSIIKTHHGENLKTFTYLRAFIEHFRRNTIPRHI
jgi:hypothetical protein